VAGPPAGSANRRAEAWVGLFQLHQLTHQRVELAVRDRRGIEHVIAPARLVDPLTEISMSLTRLCQRLRQLNLSIAGRRNLFSSASEEKVSSAT
jgi:hypothetical protein